jgi:hypothetical protein
MLNATAPEAAHEKRTNITLDNFLVTVGDAVR